VSRKADTGVDGANRRTGWRLALVVVGMFAFGYALVPLYSVICQVTGLNGKTGRADAVGAPVDSSRWVTVEFTGSSMTGLPWEFQPLQKSVRVHPGEVAEVYYQARNPTGDVITGQAVPSLAPNEAAVHFKKIECFCFTRQTLNPGEARKMPVRFFVEPSLAKSVNTVTLSYSFFNVDPVSAKKFGARSDDLAEAAVHHEHDAVPATPGG
jgi:cytochrome c oxidase assembly protein subunit 11